MSEEQLEELQEYNLEYLEAQENEEIDIDYDKLQKAINDIKNMQKEADKQLENDLHKMIFGSDKE